MRRKWQRQTPHDTQLELRSASAICIQVGDECGTRSRGKFGQRYSQGTSSALQKPPASHGLIHYTIGNGDLESAAKYKLVL